MNRFCSRCGCSSFHYNRSRMRMECDLCGHPVYDPQQDQQLMQYDRTYSLALSHLAAGNWEQTINLLKPLMSQYPTEKRVYLAILRAATQNFRDIDMENTSNKRIASETWDKLVRLNGVTNEMLTYSKQCYEKRVAKLTKQRNKIITWIFVAAICSILAGVFFAIKNYFFFVLFMSAPPGFLFLAISNSPIKVIGQLMNSQPNYQQNPFTQED